MEPKESEVLPTESTHSLIQEKTECSSEQTLGIEEVTLEGTSVVTSEGIAEKSPVVEDDDSSLYDDEEVFQLSPPKTKLAEVEGARSSDDKESSLNRFRNMTLEQRVQLLEQIWVTYNSKICSNYRPSFGNEST